MKAKDALMDSIAEDVADAEHLILRAAGKVGVLETDLTAAAARRDYCKDWLARLRDVRSELAALCGAITREQNTE